MDFDLAATIADLEPLLGPQFAAKGIRFDHDACAADTPDRPHADPEKLRQILLNLLTNAVKFTDAGGLIMVRCETDKDGGVVRIRVRDTGRGIPTDQLEKIFEHTGGGEHFHPVAATRVDPATPRIRCPDQWDTGVRPSIGGSSISPPVARMQRARSGPGASRGRGARMLEPG